MPLSTPFQSPRLYNVIAVLLSTLFLLFSGIICGPLWGSLAVLGSFAVLFGDHLRSGIICGLGIICGAVQVEGKMSQGLFQNKDTVFSSYCIFRERTYEARGNVIQITKPLKPTNFNFPKWQTESLIPSKIINEILICVL